MSNFDPLKWLSQDVMPLWQERAVDRENGGFAEMLSMDGTLLKSQRRCMVQARQIYSMRTAMDLGVCDKGAAKSSIISGAKFMISRFSLPSGAFRHAVSDSGEPVNEMADLYGQAFALFGLACAHKELPEAKPRALLLLQYLKRERLAKGGGYTEIEDGKVVYRSNPHMHLFEAALEWVEADSDQIWKNFATELLELCQQKFIESKSGCLAEKFDEGWVRETTQGKFFFEPGHHCEWAWLMGRYQKLVGRDLMKTRESLFDIAERTGKIPHSKALIDQVWNDFTPALTSARFWPQCERIKAASQLGRRESAQEGMEVLSKYFETKRRGLWFDTMEANGTFRDQPVKASSLYHIIGAISEFQKLP